jgi:transmembrane sensor
VTGTGEIRTVALVDGSRVHLDADTAIAIRYGPDRREIVLLAGQAFFEVAKAPDRPFVVASDAVRTTAIGTAFSVRSDPETISVALQSGVVDVRSGGPRGHTATLAPGERLRVSRADGRFRRSRVFAETIAAWRERRLIVDSARLADVVRQLDSHYRGRVLLRDAALANARVTGVFDLRHPIDALRAIVRTQRGSVLQVTPYLAVVSGP